MKVMGFTSELTGLGVAGLLCESLNEVHGSHRQTLTSSGNTITYLKIS